MSSLKEEYLKKAEDLKLTNELNQDQKDLIKLILDKFDDNDKNLQNIYQFLIKRIKLGFVFDVAPSVDSKQIALLKKDEKLSFGDFIDPNQNYLIIGENYDALKNLLVIEREREREQISSKFDVIYIDPPYNTESSLKDGNNLSEKDEVSASKFVYRDKFSRTGWLNMLNERLIMARQLLKEEGVIFVSIDDNEQAYLKVLMDEIFGEENFLNILVWISNKKGRQISKSQYSKIYEYILVYAKDIKKLDVNFNKSRDDLNKLMPEFYNNDDDEIKVDENGEFLLLNEFHNTNINAFNIDTRRNLFYPIFVNEQEISTVPGEGLIRILPPKNKEGTQAVWRWEKDKLEKEKHNLYVEKLGDKLKILTKKRDITFKIKDVLLNSNMTTRSGTIELDNVIKGSQFKTVKPTSLIKFLINISNNKNARILDFYAGSGTTGHAVMELNREDGGNRSYTLVTNNENNIGIDVCYERLYRINKGISINGDSNFAWIKKNEPYQSNLNVFNLEYFDTSIFNESDSNEKIKDIFIKELIDFGINKENIDNLEILRDLTSLKPISKENNDASN